MKALNSSEYRDLIRTAESQGWQQSITAKNHIRMKSPDGKRIVIGSSTPSCRSSFRDFRADLRRAGLMV